MRRATGLAIVALVAVAGPALAQSSLGIGVSEQAIDTAQRGPLGEFFRWIAEHQRDFYDRLRAALIDIRDSGAALWLLIGLSFAYGVLHAAGPGHGKVVISSYMLANETALRRGIWLSFGASIIQAISAIVIVGLGFLVLRQLSISQTQTTQFAELASYVLVIGLGLWLLVRKLAALRVPRARPAALSAAAVDHHHHHDHDDHPQHGHDHGHHAHDHGPGESCPSCGHAHMPAPDQLKDVTGWRDALAVMVSVGVRPCTGGLIVLTFAFVSGLWVAGIVSVFAMAIGVTITVSILATLAVTAKNVALRLSGASAVSGGLGHAIEIGGALLIIAMGVVLLGGALNA